MFSTFRLSSNQDNRYGGVSKIVIPDYLADSLIRKIFLDITRINGMINEYGVLLPKLNEVVLVILIVLVVVTNEYLVH